MNKVRYAMKYGNVIIIMSNKPLNRVNSGNTINILSNTISIIFT